jgi:hypothetical protein
MRPMVKAKRWKKPFGVVTLHTFSDGGERSNARAFRRSDTYNSGKRAHRASWRNSYSGILIRLRNFLARRE